MESFARDDAPVDYVPFVDADDDGGLVLWHACRIRMHERILHQYPSDFTESFVGVSVRAVRLP